MVINTLNIFTKISLNCVFCDLPAHNPEVNICSKCFDDLPWLQNHCFTCALPLPSSAIRQQCKLCIDHPPAYNQTWAAFNYQFPLNLLMPVIKIDKNRHHLHWMASCLVAKIKAQSDYVLPQVIIPTPISKAKLIRKGFNQTQYLASLINKKLTLDVDKSLVYKIRETSSQADLNAQQRRRNLIGAFKVNANNYSHVAIIDDVMTTGSTMHEMAKELRGSGVQTIDIWIIARTPR